MNLASSYPSARYTSLLIAITVCLAASSAAAISNPDWGYLAVAAGPVVVVGIRDLLQPDHSILRKYRSSATSGSSSNRSARRSASTCSSPRTRQRRSRARSGRWCQRAKNEEDKQPFGTFDPQKRASA